MLYFRNVKGEFFEMSLSNRKNTTFLPDIVSQTNYLGVLDRNIYNSTANFKTLLGVKKIPLIIKG